jgi:hypothetical protein
LIPIRVKAATVAAVVNQLVPWRQPYSKFFSLSEKTLCGTHHIPEADEGKTSKMTEAGMTEAGMAGAGRAAAQPAVPGQPVLVRALSLLAQFTEHRRALGLSELARLAGLSPATCLRLVRHLTEWGALERLEDGRYVVGVRLWEIASLSPRGHGVRQVALPYLEDLYEVTRHHVLLSVLEGRDAVLIDRLSSRMATEVAYRGAAGCRCAPPPSGRSCWLMPTPNCRRRYLPNLPPPSWALAIFPLPDCARRSRA